MSISVPNVSTPTVQASTADPNKSAETPSTTPPQTSTTPPKNNNDPQQDRHAFLKECRDWLNSVIPNRVNKLT